MGRHDEFFVSRAAVLYTIAERGPHLKSYWTDLHAKPTSHKRTLKWKRLYSEVIKIQHTYKQAAKRSKAHKLAFNAQYNFKHFLRLYAILCVLHLTERASVYRYMYGVYTNKFNHSDRFRSAELKFIPIKTLSSTRCVLDYLQFVMEERAQSFFREDYMAAKLRYETGKP